MIKLPIARVLCFGIMFILTHLSVTGQLKMLETKDLRLVSYDFGHAYILPHAARCFHNTLNFHKDLFQYQPTEKVSVLIQDFGDYGNAGATAIPKNFISMGLSPFSYAFETNPAGERVYSMMNHELVHVVALDQSTSADRFYQGLFLGKVEPSKDHPISMFYSFLTSPRRYSPRWYHEGLAAYIETWMNGGIGLAMGSFDEMVFRTLVLENSRIYSAQGLESEGVTTDFQGRSNSYLYGTRFMGYLSHHYGPQNIIEWAKRNDGTKRFFVGQFKNVFGVPINQAWDDWIAFERTWQLENIQALKEFEISKTELITETSLGSVSFPHFDKKRNKIYLAVNFPGRVPHLAAINLGAGKLEHLTDIKGPALFYVSSVCFDEEGDVIYFTSDNDAWRDLMQYDLATGKTNLLQEDFRTGDLSFNNQDKSIWGIKHLNGFSTIVRIPKFAEDSNEMKKYNTWDQMHTLPYGHDIFDLDISPDGRYLSAAVSNLGGNQYLLLYEIASFQNDTPSVDTIFNFEVSSPQSFRFTEDGKYLFGSSYYSGVSNIFRVDMSNYDILPMSNTLTGLFRPLQIDENKLFAFEFHSDGFKPVYLPNSAVSNVSSIEYLGTSTIENHPELKEWELPIQSSENIDLPSMDMKELEYKPGQLMSINYAYPIVVGYKNNFGIGYRMNISDPFGLKEIDIEASYTPKSWENSLANEEDSLYTQLDDDEQFHFSFYGKSRRYSFFAAYNEASFYDLFGPVRHSRKGISAGVNFDHSIIWDPPITLDIHMGLSGFYGLDQSPDFQQITLQGFDDNFYLNYQTSLTYQFFKTSIGAVDYEKGLKTSLQFSLATSSGEFFPRLATTFDYGVQLPVKHLSLWLRTAAGRSFKSDLNPFTRFGFAAFGNNYIDYQSSRRYRTIYSFPGLPIDNDRHIIARDFAKGMLEAVLPPIRFRRFGGFNFYTNWIQPSIFTSILVTDDPSTASNTFANVGFQFETRMVMFSMLTSTLSIGYARAWDLDSEDRFGEFMISLKLLK